MSQQEGELTKVLTRQDFWNNIEDQTEDIDKFKCQWQEKDYFSSTQVNMDEETKKDQNISLKKNKKKEYKRRKKEKDTQNEKRGKAELTRIIESIYCHQTSFAKNSKQIQECLEFLRGGDKFHQFLNQTIRNHVKDLQKQIWEYTQTILHENIQEKPQTINFYLKMVQWIYKHYESIKQSSKEIQKIINLYVNMTSHHDCSNDQYNYRDLDKNTFNYLIQSDDTLKNLIHACNRKIDTHHIIHKNKLKKMAEVLIFCEVRDYEDDDDADDEYDQEWAEKSTSIEQEEEFHGQNEQKRKKRNRKFRQSQIRCQFEDVMRRIKTFSINEDQRLPCRVDESWINQIQQSIASKIQ